uniref:Uncharacterized protein n=1 Tax=Aegilops tauschii subsp. strangulata TaxID=200361 RepID=A0A453BJ09_AEGTS
MWITFRFFCKKNPATPARTRTRGPRPIPPPPRPRPSARRRATVPLLAATRPVPPTPRPRQSSPWCPSSLRRRRIWTRSRESAASRAAARRPCGEDERAARRTCREHGRAAHRRPSHSPAEDGAQPPRRRTPPTCRPVYLSYSPAPWIPLPLS